MLHVFVIKSGHELSNVRDLSRHPSFDENPLPLLRRITTSFGFACIPRRHFSRTHDGRCSARSRSFSFGHGHGAKLTTASAGNGHTPCVQELECNTAAVTAYHGMPRGDGLDGTHGAPLLTEQPFEPDPLFVSFASATYLLLRKWF